MYNYCKPSHPPQEQEWEWKQTGRDIRSIEIDITMTRGQVTQEQKEEQNFP